MKIAVCVKEVPDAGPSRRIDPATLRMDRSGDRSLNLPDGLHPTAKGVEIIVERITPSVESFLARLSQR